MTTKPQKIEGGKKKRDILMKCEHLIGLCLCCGDNECALYGTQHKHPTPMTSKTGMESHDGGHVLIHTTTPIQETCEVYEVAYAWEKWGDKTTCAWCHKDIKKIKDPTDHIEAHDHTQKEYEKKIESLLQRKERETIKRVMEKFREFFELNGKDQEDLYWINNIEVDDILDSLTNLNKE